MGMPGAYLGGGSESIPLCAGGNASRRGIRILAAPAKRGQPGGPRSGEREAASRASHRWEARKGTGQQG